MSRHRLASRITVSGVVLFTLLAGSANYLHAQQEAAPALQPTPVQSEAAGQVSPEPATTSPVQAGPRVTPPLESYQGTLPHSQYDSMAQDSEGSRHTIVLSTLALVLIGVIVVLLAT